MPEVGAPDVSLGGEQRGEHRGLSAPENINCHNAALKLNLSPVNSERPNVTRQVCVHVARVDVVHHDVLPGVAVHHPLLDPGSRGSH